MNNLRHGELPWSWAVGLGFLAVYAPFSWLMFTEWQYIKLWPVFPGLVICHFIRSNVSGAGAVILVQATPCFAPSS